jgi:hypothetical protein
MKNDPRELESFEQDLSTEPFLGDPAVVTGLVSGFVQQIYDWMKACARGEMTGDEFKAKAEAESKRMSEIFFGRDPAYLAIKGWNSPYGVGMALKQSMGEFWTRYGASHGDDPVRAVCAWLAAHLVDAARKSQSPDGDPDLEGLGMRQRIEQVSRTLLGTHRRA